MIKEEEGGLLKICEKFHSVKKMIRIILIFTRSFSKTG